VLWVGAANSPDEAALGVIFGAFAAGGIAGVLGGFFAGALIPPRAHPPAWLPDPTSHYQFRYWDGEQWTDHAATDGTVAHDPLA